MKKICEEQLENYYIYFCQFSFQFGNDLSTFYINTFQKIRVTNIQTIELLYTIEPGEFALFGKKL